jgi:hypothetical protein
METRKTLTERIEEDSITIRAEYQGEDTLEGDTHYMHHWIVTLTRGKQEMSLDFWMGRLLTDTPTVEDVLESILLEANSVENAQDFRDWAEDFGYNADSIKALESFKSSQRQTRQLKRLLGDKYDAYMYETESL